MAVINAASPGSIKFTRTWVTLTQSGNTRFIRLWLNRVAPSPSQSSGTTRPTGGQMQPRNK